MVNLYCPVRFTSNTSFHSSSSISCNCFILGKIPALFTRISNLPNFSIILFTTFFTSFEFLMSAAIPIALGISFTAFSNLSLSFAVIVTVAPFSDRIFAVANPIPGFHQLREQFYQLISTTFKRNFVIYRSINQK